MVTFHIVELLAYKARALDRLRTFIASHSGSLFVHLSWQEHRQGRASHLRSP